MFISDDSSKLQDNRLTNNYNIQNQFMDFESYQRMLGPSH